MFEERDNFIIVEPNDERVAPRQEEQNASPTKGDALFAEYVAHRDEFKKWLIARSRKERMAPKNDEEARVYSCAGWHVYSPRWDAEEALSNPNTRSWEDIQIFSTVRSLAWMREHNPGCECVPLRINDQRCAEEKLSKFRQKRKKVHRKQSFTPNATELGEGDAL